MANTRKENLNVADICPIQFEHYKVHDGEMYSANIFFTVTAASNFDILFKGPTGATAEIHMKMGVETDGAAKFVLVEDCTCTSDTTTSFGTSFSPSPINMNRNSTKTDLVQFRYSPSNPSGGTTLTVDLFGTATSKMNYIGASVRNETELVLKPDTKYWIRCTNNAASTITASFECEYYTVEPT